MQSSPIEKRMYAVMDAICDSGLPIVFKGAMVLHALLYENGYTGDVVRQTRDIDANWLSKDAPTMEVIRTSIQRVLTCPPLTSVTVL